jgi:uncharacterized protein YabN with tetrapyrrole methylase and pyrophosphatase domain
VEAEVALQSTVDKFIRRFKYIEEQVQLRGGDYSAFSLEELDHWWEEAKKQERRGARAQEPDPDCTPPEKRNTT